MLSLAEISDRLEIQQLLIDYSTAIDQRRFDDLDRVFTPDAYIDYRAFGGTEGQYPQVKAWLAEVLPNFPSYSHMLGNFDVRIGYDSYGEGFRIIQWRRAVVSDSHSNAICRIHIQGGGCPYEHT